MRILTNPLAKKTRKKGKLISVFDYQNHGQHLKLEIRLIERDGQLVYQTTNDQPLIDLVHKDANELKLLVRDALDRVINIQWKNMLCMRWESQRPIGSNLFSFKHVEMSFQVERWRIGNSSTGDMVHSEPQIDKDHDPHVWNGLPDIIEEREHHKSVQVGQAMIDDTPENRQHIAKIIASFNQLGKQMSELFSQKNIATVLALVAEGGMPLLPHGKPVTKDVRPDSDFDSDEDVDLD